MKIRALAVTLALFCVIGFEVFLSRAVSPQPEQGLILEGKLVALSDTHLTVEYESGGKLFLRSFPLASDFEKAIVMGDSTLSMEKNAELPLGEQIRILCEQKGGDIVASACELIG